MTGVAKYIDGCTLLLKLHREKLLLDNSTSAIIYSSSTTETGIHLIAFYILHITYDTQEGQI